ncbi:DinB family protein [Rapidithrix thailandica]|uniref:DinB family protein n=1 Tax=Rapidithrix thailandica TaxID=413964 RepID=A0AAW9SB16_9BACT
MQKPLSNEYNPYYQNYIDLVPDGDFFEMLRDQRGAIVRFFEDLPEEKYDYQYAEGKWTIKEVLMHILDTERVMAYRALVAARGDKTTKLQNMDEGLYARNMNASDRTMKSLLDEFKAIRHSTVFLYENMPEEQSQWEADAVTHPFTARALGYIIIGHVQHHLNVIQERYL